MNDGPTKSQIFTLFLVAIFCMACVIYIVIKDERTTKTTTRTTPPLRRYNYEPVYVQLNNEQFERLIEALKGEAK